MAVIDAVNDVLLEVVRLRDTLRSIASADSSYHPLHNPALVSGYASVSDDRLAQQATPQQYTKRDLTVAESTTDARNEKTAPIIAAIQTLGNVAGRTEPVPHNAHCIYVAYAATHALVVWARSLYPNIDPIEAPDTCVALMATTARSAMQEVIFPYGGQRVYERMHPLTAWIENHTDDLGVALHNLLLCTQGDFVPVGKWLEIISTAIELPVWD